MLGWVGGKEWGRAGGFCLQKEEESKLGEQQVGLGLVVGDFQEQTVQARGKIMLQIQG